MLLLCSAVSSLACAGLFRHDHDQDGYTGDVDCDDENPDAHPDAAEVCDDANVDEDCNGAADDQDPNPGGLNLWYADLDEDNHGDRSGATVESCDAPDGYGPPDDCDDGDSSVHPGADEHCEDLDEDCDGQVDEEPVDGSPTYTDDDGDGFGTGDSISECRRSTGRANEAGDCDDTNREVNPGAPETCNGVDDDCDGDVDDEDSDVANGTVATWYRDADGDGWGDSTHTSQSCGPPDGYVAEAGDCDDGDGGVHPEAAEVCGDGVDQNCDGGAPECAWAGDVDNSLAGATFTSPGEDCLGCSTTRIPDTDGDGIDDLAIADELEGSAGAVWVWTGAPTGAQTTASASGGVSGNDASEGFGAMLAAGELDGDNRGDLVVSTRSSDVGSVTNMSAVYVFEGPFSRGLDTADATGARYSTDSTHPITDIHLLADQDGDGREELLVGTSANSGYLFRGPLTGTSALSSATTTITSAQGTLEIGVSLCPAGDIDGDGLEDVLIGTFDNLSGPSQAGSVYLALGPLPSGTMRDSDTDGLRYGVVEGEAAGDCFPGADVNGDGHADSVTGAFTWEGGPTYVVLGPWSGTASFSTADASIATSGVYLGNAVDARGDADGDGRADLLINAGGEDGSLGAVHIFYGPSLSGALDVGDADVTFTAPRDARSFGLSIGWLDANGDALSDVLIGDADSSDGDSRAFLYQAGGI